MAQAQADFHTAAAPARLAPLTLADLDAVLHLEQRSYSRAWTRRNFADSLAAGQALQGLWHGDALIGYFVAMAGVDEVHLLKLTVAPDWRRQGWARVLLDALVLWAQRQGAHNLWLEVRASNAPALALYRRFGFAQVGLRKAYYPLGRGQYDDALLMTYALPGTQP